LIALRGVRKAFDGRAVHDGVDLDVPRGATTAIIGRSGSGKSVLLKIIVGLVPPDAGEVRVGETDVMSADAAALRALRMRVGMVFQFGALLDSLTVFGNVVFGLREHRPEVPVTDLRRIAIDRLAEVGLGVEVLDLLPAALSGGMRKRVAVARALAMEPEVVLYDEPTAGLDPIAASSANDLIRAMRARHGVTQVVVTHDLESAFRVADRVALLYKGRIVEEGPPEAIRASTHPVVRQFVRGEAAGPMADEDEARPAASAPSLV
jgi:phospholipid/cholesterol/gamma-HCH transport system ATP-binding protein